MGNQVEPKVFNKSSFFEDPDVTTAGVLRQEDVDRMEQEESKLEEIEEFKEDDNALNASDILLEENLPQTHPSGTNLEGKVATFKPNKVN